MPSDKELSILVVDQLIGDLIYDLCNDEELKREACLEFENIAVKSGYGVCTVTDKRMDKVIDQLQKRKDRNRKLYSSYMTNKGHDGWE